jgi:hypothetical protein
VAGTIQLDRKKVFFFFFFFSVNVVVAAEELGFCLDKGYILAENHLKQTIYPWRINMAHLVFNIQPKPSIYIVICSCKLQV